MRRGCTIGLGRRRADGIVCVLRKSSQRIGSCRTRRYPDRNLRVTEGSTLLGECRPPWPSQQTEGVSELSVTTSCQPAEQLLVKYGKRPHHVRHAATRRDLRLSLLPPHQRSGTDPRWPPFDRADRRPRRSRCPRTCPRSRCSAPVLWPFVGEGGASGGSYRFGHGLSSRVGNNCMTTLSSSLGLGE